MPTESNPLNSFLHPTQQATQPVARYLVALIKLKPNCQNSFSTWFSYFQKIDPQIMDLENLILLFQYLDDLLLIQMHTG